jgi:integrase
MATFRKLPSGSWQVRVRRFGVPTLTKSFSSKLIAQKWARQIEYTMDEGSFIDRAELDTTTLGDLIDRYMVEITPTKKSHKAEKFRLVLMRKSIGYIGLNKIQSKHIAEYRNKRLADGCANGTVIKDINSLSHIFNVAMKDWGIPLLSNPAQMVRKPSAGRGRDRRLKDGELVRLLDALNKTCEIKIVVLLAIETAMRRAEILSLLWSNIYLEDRYLILPDTKNGEVRAVPLSTNAISILRSLVRNTDKVFSIKPDSITRGFKRACKRAGLEDLRFHDLRHEATSRFFELGLNTMEVSAITGHKTLSMLKRYTHLKAKDLALKLG